MNIPSREIVEKLRRDYPEGAIVRLDKMDDPQAPPVETVGVVRGVDDIGSIMVRWGNGSGLSVAYGEDKCTVIADKDGFIHPTQIIFYDPELEEEHAGIAYGKEVICLECGGTFELKEITVRRALSWISLEDECIGS